MLKILGRTAVLLGLGLLVLGLMALYVLATQHRPAPDDPLRVTTVQDIILPWEEAQLRIHYSGIDGAVDTGPPLPTTVVFLLDTSSSMNNLVGDAARAIVALQRDLSTASQPPRIGVMGFASSPTLLIPITGDMPQLAAELARMQTGAGGGTAFLPALDAVLKLLAADGSTGTVVMLTDAESPEPIATLAEFFERTWKPRGHELFMVGIGAGADLPPAFAALTEDPGRYVLSSADPRIIGRLFQEVALRMGNGIGRNVRLRLPLADPLWQWGPAPEPALDAHWSGLAPPTKGDDLQMTALFARPYEWRVTLTPRIGGILSTLRDSPSLRYAGLDGQNYRVDPTDTGAPELLVLTWTFLFWLAAPALLYLLAELLAWLLRDRAEVPEVAPVQWRPDYRPPPNLPLRCAPRGDRIEWAPTLVIGLGRSGRAALTHLQQNLEDSFDDPAVRPVLLALDVARDELAADGGGEAFAGCLERLTPAQVCVLPAAACALQDSIPAQQARVRLDPGDPLAALDLTPYETMGADALRLLKGSRGEAPLARLALLNDLAGGTDSAVLKRLGTALASWRALLPTERNRQILLVANVGGGVGGGWLTDLLILLRRMVAVDEQNGQAVEINVLLLGDVQPRGAAPVVPLTAPRLFAELDRLAAAGARPFRHRLVADAPAELAQLLDGQVVRRPQDGLFVLPRHRAPGADGDTWPTAADLLTLLIDRRRRVLLSFELQAQQGIETARRAEQGREFYTELAIHNAAFPRSFFRALLHIRLLNWIGCHQVLFPERARTAGRPTFTPLRLDPALLLPATLLADPRDPVAALAALLTGQGSGPDAASAVPDVLAEACQRLRVGLAETLTRALQEQRIGLLGLAEVLSEASTRLADRAAALGDNEPLAALASDLAGARRQALIWLELFFGSDVLAELGPGAMLSGQPGLLDAHARDEQRVLTTLDEWAQAPSRLLISPLGGYEAGATPAREPALNNLLERFLRDWLAIGDGELVTGLAARCCWELSLPGSDGSPLGVTLLLRGTQVIRFAPDAGALVRFEQALTEQTGPVFDDAIDFHVLALLAASLPADDDGAMAAFARRLKGPLRGERIPLLATLPDLALAPEPALHAFRDRLAEALQRATVSAAERIDLRAVPDRTRISLLQAVPLLTAVAAVDQEAALHGPERRLCREAERFAAVHGRTRADLPAVLGIALEERGALTSFARLYRNGQVRRSVRDGLWYARDTATAVRLTLLPGQTLADAAAWFASHPVEVTLGGAGFGTLPPAESDDDLAEYLDWLATA